ncbi:MAG TPA: hypothetical protein VGS61_00515 [Acidimicrobiales bacterium]|nr:hypothetical protein [Acidimicrobiales bacterium]
MAQTFRQMLTGDEDPGVRRIQLVLATIAAGLVVVDVLAAFIFPWWRHRMVADFWPLDTSRIAPKIIATLVQAVIGMIFIAVFWPPLRRSISRLLEEGGHRANAELHRKLAEVHARLDDVMTHHGEVHSKLDHIIRHHPDVPDYNAGASARDEGAGTGGRGSSAD